MHIIAEVVNLCPRKKLNVAVMKLDFEKSF